MPPELADLSAAHCVLPSEQELMEYFGTIDADSGASALFDHGAQSVIVKQGNRGVTVYEGRGETGSVIPAYQTERVVDTTGAGDSFGGGFFVGLAETGDMRKAALYGSVSASFVIEGYGAEHTLSVSRREAEERLSHLSKKAGIHL